MATAIPPASLQTSRDPQGLVALLSCQRRRRLSSEVPEGIQADYREAYLVVLLSPKASATLARRALQGIVRHFWGVSKSRLAEELKDIEGRRDPEVYAAMMAVKSIGNIGVNPERDINVIIDIEPSEAQQLLDLIHLLDHEWYVARAQKRARVASITALGHSKAAEQKQGVGPKT